jgi:hypothetical protein
MAYNPQYRIVFSDINVTPWSKLVDDLFDSPEDAYAAICRHIKGVPDRVGFTDAPENGDIRTGSGYGDASLFEDPRNRAYQFRVIFVGSALVQVKPFRTITLE